MKPPSSNDHSILIIGASLFILLRKEFFLGAIVNFECGLSQKPNEFLVAIGRVLLTDLLPCIGFASKVSRQILAHPCLSPSQQTEDCRYGEPSQSVASQTCRASLGFAWWDCRAKIHHAFYSRIISTEGMTANVPRIKYREPARAHRTMFRVDPMPAPFAVILRGSHVPHSCLCPSPAGLSSYQQPDCSANPARTLHASTFTGGLPVLYCPPSPNLR